MTGGQRPPQAFQLPRESLQRKGSHYPKIPTSNGNASRRLLEVEVEEKEEERVRKNLVVRRICVRR